MSASAEVYITISTDNETGNRYSEIVDKWLENVGFSTSGENYRRTSVLSGDIYEVRGYHVSYDVFGQEWSASLVKELYFLDKGLDVEVFVYNLDREADASYSTNDIPEDYEEPQGCDDCGNVNHTCVCDGGIGPNIVEEVVK